jgi:ribosome assembly protein YihI (activator of Der GTPase)
MKQWKGKWWRIKVMAESKETGIIEGWEPPEETIYNVDRNTALKKLDKKPNGGKSGARKRRQEIAHAHTQAHFIDQQVKARMPGWGRRR